MKQARLEPKDCLKQIRRMRTHLSAPTFTAGDVADVMIAHEALLDLLGPALEELSRRYRTNGLNSWARALKLALDAAPKPLDKGDPFAIQYDTAPRPDPLRYCKAVNL